MNVQVQCPLRAPTLLGPVASDSTFPHKLLGEMNHLYCLFERALRPINPLAEPRGSALAYGHF